MGTVVPWDDHGVASLVQSRITSATLPVILCAPHGGNAVDGDQSETLRERPPVSPSTHSCGGGRSVSLVADVGTSQLLEEIDRRLSRKCSGDASGFATVTDAAAAVVARFHRKYVDANRSLGDEQAVAVHPACARGRDVHNCYHHTIEAAIGSLGSRFREQGVSPLGSMGGGDGAKQEAHEKEIRLLLLDVHGQCKFGNKLLIGTRNGKTADLQTLNRPGKGFLWHLRQAFSAEDGASQGCGEQDGAGGTECEQQERKHTNNGEEIDQINLLGQQQNEEGGLAKKNDEVGVLPLAGKKEVPGYTGGYTVQRHGILARAAVAPAPAATGIEGAEETKAISGRVAVAAVDAIQLEFGSRLRRTSEARAVTAEAVASAIFSHLKEQQQQQQQQPIGNSSSD